MKKIIPLPLLCAAILFCMSSADAQDQTNMVIPVAPSSSDAPWTDSQCFWSGVTLGFTWGGVAWIFRLVRQPGKQNPEM